MSFVRNSFMVLMLTLLSSCLSSQAFAQPVDIKFEIAGYTDSVIYVGNHFGSEKYLLDTINVKNGKFTFNHKELEGGLYFLYYPNFYFEFVLEEHSFGLETTKEDSYKNLVVTNSKENELFKQFQLELGSLQRDQRKLSESLKEASKEDSARIYDSLRDLSLEVKKSREAMIDANKDSFVASFLSLMGEPEMPDLSAVADERERNLQRYLFYKQKFFSGGVLSDGRLLRTPIIHAKVMRYFDQAVIQQPDSINQALDWFFDQIPNNEEAIRYWLVTLFKKYADSKQMGMDAVTIHLIESYYLAGKAPWISGDYEKKLREEVAYIKPNLLGSRAPRIDAVDPFMEPFNLSLIESEFTLLFIYDPDCGHCKKTIAKMQDDEMRFSELGIAIVALCTTTDVERWKDFIDNANQDWYHAIDPTGKSYFRVSYNVRSTPQIYLLNGQKEIIAKKLEIDQFLDFAERYRSAK